MVEQSEYEKRLVVGADTGQLRVCVIVSEDGQSRAAPATLCIIPSRHLAAEEKQMLSRCCAMTVKQITDWFTNFRVRKHKKVVLELAKVRPHASCLLLSLSCGFERGGAWTIPQEGREPSSFARGASAALKARVRHMDAWEACRRSRKPGGRDELSERQPYVG